MPSSYSVIIPCYNCEKTIIETLNSVFNQSMVPYEVICVDDGSTDSTVRLIENYSSGNFKPLLIKKEHLGVSAARNTGIKIATGDVVFFLDSDDYFSKNFCEFAIQLLDSGYDCVFGKYTHDCKKIALCNSYRCLCETKAQTMFMTKKKIFHFSAVAYKRNVIQQHCLSFLAGIKYGEDWEFATKYMSHCKRFALINQNVLFYRIMPDSAFRTITYDHVDAIKSAENAEEYLYKSKSNFYTLFHSYMKHKVVFSLLHIFSKNRRKDLYTLLIGEYDTTKSMKALLKSRLSSLKEKIAIVAYLISSNLFYYTIGRL